MKCHSKFFEYDGYNYYAPIAVIGDNLTGKTSLMKILYSKFGEGEEDNCKLILFAFNECRTVLDIDDNIFLFQITKFKSGFITKLLEMFYTNKGIMIIYDISNKESFLNIDKYLKYIDLSKQVVLLVGNKSDLREERQVTKCEGEDKSKDLGVLWTETSIFDHSSIKDAFVEIIRELMRKKLLTNMS